MRVLLDECLPRRLKREIVGHDARTVPEMGWASKRNGELLALGYRVGASRVWSILQAQAWTRHRAGRDSRGASS